MATDIYDESQLVKIIKNDIAIPLLQEVSVQAIALMQEQISKNAKFSTYSLQNSMTYKIDPNTLQSSVYIDYDLCQQIFGRPPEYVGKTMVEWGNFRNSFGYYKGSGKWNGEWLAFRVADWLNSGGSGYLGNQPIKATHWFDKTVSAINRKLNSWCRQFFAERGIKVK